MNPELDDKDDKTPPFRPCGAGMEALLDAPEFDDGVVAEAVSYGAEGCKTLLALVAPSSNLDVERRARGVHLLSLMDCQDLMGLAPELMQEGVLSIQISLVYALVRLDRAQAEKLLLPLVASENVDTLLREHTAYAVLAGADGAVRQALADSIGATQDERLRRELERWLVLDDPPDQPNPDSDAPTPPDPD